jgi:uncharacterized membrane protein SpoIIM required for sporulation
MNKPEESDETGALLRSDRLEAVGQGSSGRRPARYEPMGLPGDDTGTVAKTHPAADDNGTDAKTRTNPDDGSSRRQTFGGISSANPIMPTKRQWNFWRRLRLPANAFDPEHRTVRVADHSTWLIWLGLGLLAALIGQAAGVYVFWQGQSWNGALLFTICVLAGYIFPAFQRHAKAVWSAKESPWTANKRLAAELTGLFLGTTAGYLAGPVLLGAEGYFSLMVGARELGDPIARLDLAPVKEIFVHNMRVFGLFFLLGFVFRYLGILFAIVYNASIWGLVIGVSVMADTTAVYLGSLSVGGPVLVLLLLPHAILEILAYVLAAMAGVFVSRLVGRYRLFSPKLTGVMLSIYKVLIIGIAVLGLAAVTEALIDQPLLRAVFDQSRIAAFPPPPEGLVEP